MKDAKKPPPPFVTAEELQEVNEALEQLRNEVATSSLEAQAEQRRAVEEVNADLLRLRDSQLRDLQLSIDASAKALQQQSAAAEVLAGRTERLEQEATKLQAAMTRGFGYTEAQIKAGADSLQELGAKVEMSFEQAQQALKETSVSLERSAKAHAKSAAAKAQESAREELAWARQAIEKQVFQNREASRQQDSELEASIAALGERLDAALAAAVEGQRAALASEASGLRAHTEALHRGAREAASSSLAKAEDARAQRDAVQSERAQRLEDEIRRCFRETERLDQNHQDAALETKHQFGQSEENLARVQAANCKRLDILEASDIFLRETCSELLGHNVRQVEWHLEHAIDEVALVEEGMSDGPSRSWLSPKFDIAGGRGLQLELRSLRPKDRPEARRDAGDCSVFLWAPEGMHLVFRLLLGSESLVLRHHFDGKVPCGMDCICFLAEQVHDGHLRIGVEILEALHEVKTPDALGTLIVRRLTSSNGVTAQAITDGHPEEQQEQEEAEEAEETHTPALGSLISQRYFNHRLLELIKCQGRGLADIFRRKMDVVRSRSVRRVQWRLEQAFSLRQSFASGKAVCSTAFQAAGISGLQLIFYPSGCVGARPGFCSFFVSCPPGCTVRCWLWAGRWRREAHPEPSTSKDFVGRVNFARFENCIDPVDEGVELALEIEEANQISHETSSMPVEDTLLKQESHSEQMPSLDTMEREDVTTLRLQPSLGAKTSTSDENVKQLPNMFTSHGFQTFVDSVDSSSAAGGSNRGGSTHRPVTTGGSFIKKATTPRGGASVVLPPAGRVHKYKEYM